MINNQNLAVLSEKVAYLEAAIKEAGIELPSVTADDNGKTLQVVAGKWDKGMKLPELPTVNTGDANKVLQVNAEGSWAADSLGVWSSEIQLADNTAFTIYGRVNKKLKLAVLRLEGKDASPSTSPITINVTNPDYESLGEYSIGIRYGAMLVVYSLSSTDTKIIVRDLDTTKTWYSGYIIYPTK